MKPIKLHLVTWNRPKMTDLVIKTIVNNTTTPYELIVWDNGSDQEMLDLLIDHVSSKKIKTLQPNGVNIGLEGARQRLLYDNLDPNDEFIVCIDNDCLPPKPNEKGEDWLYLLQQLMEKHPDYAAISMRTQVMIGTGNIFEEADETGADIVEFPHPGGSFRIMRVPQLLEVGGWTAGNSGRGSEERHVGGKLNELGYKTAFATNVKCLHLFGTRGDKNKTDRWGYDKDLPPEATGHSDIHHPVLINGDDLDEIKHYTNSAWAEEYFYD